MDFLKTGISIVLPRKQKGIEKEGEGADPEALEARLFTEQIGRIILHELREFFCPILGLLFHSKEFALEVFGLRQ